MFLKARAPVQARKVRFLQVRPVLVLRADRKPAPLENRIQSKCSSECCRNDAQNGSTDPLGNKRRREPRGKFP